MWWLATVACLAASLLPVTGAGAAEDSAATDESASGAAAATADPATENPTDGVEIVRYAGSDRYALSIQLAQALVDAGGGTSEWVVLASGESWADAAAAGPLAASLSARVVLVPSGGLQALSARTEFAELLLSAGVRRVMIVGSGIVLPNHEPSVLYGLGMLPRNIERIHGTDPVETAIAIAERIGTPAEFGDLGRTVIIASDRSVADAVAIGPLAAAGPFPLLLTAPDALDTRIAEYLADHEIAHVVIVGGTTAITSTVHESLEAAEITVTRLAGRDRSDTARLAADLFDQHTVDNPACATGPTRVGLAPAQQPEQALLAGPLLARRCTPLRYTEPGRLPADLHNTLYLISHRHEAVQVIALADEAQMPHEVLGSTVPPALIAFPSTWPEGHSRHGQGAVAIVDELGRWRHYPVGPGRGSRELADYGGEVFEWSPDGRHLAYFDGGPLFVIDVRTDEIREAVVDDPGLWFSGWHRPVWSPDSTKLAFSAFPDDESTLGSGPTFPAQDSALGSGAEDAVDDRFYRGTAEMYVFDTHTGETIRLTHNATSDEPWAWSPDSGSIAFTQAEQPIGHFSILDYATSLRVLDVATSAVTELSSSANAYPNVTWSPDGSRIAFTGYTDESDFPYGSAVFLVRRDGSELVELTFEDHSGQIYGWDRDGNRLLYSIGRILDSVEPQLFIRDVDTGENSALDLKHLQPGGPNGWSRSPDNLVYLTPLWDPYESISHVDVVTGEATRLLHARPRAHKIDLWGLSPGARNISPDETQYAAIFDDERMVVVSNSWPEGHTIIDFSEQVVLSAYGRCYGAWGEYGIRASCGTGRDF